MKWRIKSPLHWTVLCDRPKVASRSRTGFKTLCWRLHSWSAIATHALVGTCSRISSLATKYAPTCNTSAISTKTRFELVRSLRLYCLSGAAPSAELGHFVKAGEGTRTPKTFYSPPVFDSREKSFPRFPDWRDNRYATPAFRTGPLSNYGTPACGPDGIRTRSLPHAMQALYHCATSPDGRRRDLHSQPSLCRRDALLLSYGPMNTATRICTLAISM